MAITALTAYLTAQIAFGFTLAVALLLVARMTWRARRAGRFRPAARMFAAWWASLGGAWLVWALDTWIVAAAPASSAVAVLDFVLIAAYMALILVAFGSLFYYLLFLYAGDLRVARAAWVIYGMVAVALVGLLLVGRPPSDAVTGLYADALFGPLTPIAQGLQVLLLLPVLLASLALFLMIRRAPDAPSRYRVLLISTSLAFYLVMPLLFGSNPGVEPTTAVEWTREVLNKAGLIVALAAAVLAYHPPRRLRRRWMEPQEAPA